MPTLSSCASLSSLTSLSSSLSSLSSSLSKKIPVENIPLASKKLEKSFYEVAKKGQFLGSFSTKNLKYKNEFQVDNFCENLLKYNPEDGW